MLLTASELADFAAQEAAQPNSLAEQGSVLQRDRIARLAIRACSKVEGDLLEIGCFDGATSEILARVAREYDRKLICVDTWHGSGDKGAEAIGEQFEKNMRPYSDVLIVIHDYSTAPEVVEIIRKRRYAFAYCDGRMRDLPLLMGVTDGLIAVNESRQLGMAWVDGWEHLSDVRIREAWLVKR